MKTTREHQFYEMAKEAVESHYLNKGCDVDFEITGHPAFKGVPRKYLKHDYLLKYRKELPTPDVMGWVCAGWEHPRRERLVVVEFKKKPGFWDVFQARGYDELFDADSTILVSQYRLYESSKKVFQFLSERAELIRTKNGRSHIVFKFLHEIAGGKVVLAQLGTDVGILPDAAPWEV